MEEYEQNTDIGFEKLLVLIMACSFVIFIGLWVAFPESYEYKKPPTETSERKVDKNRNTVSNGWLYMHMLHQRNSHKRNNQIKR